MKTNNIDTLPIINTKDIFWFVDERTDELYNKIKIYKTEDNAFICNQILNIEGDVYIECDDLIFSQDVTINGSLFLKCKRFKLYNELVVMNNLTHDNTAIFNHRKLSIRGNYYTKGYSNWDEEAWMNTMKPRTRKFYGITTADFETERRRIINTIRVK